jgi:hypothetical protein
MRTHSLSTGARLLYFELDDSAGNAATTYVHQQTLAVRLGIARTRIKSWLAELVAAKYISVTRDRTERPGNLYRLAWEQGTKMTPAIPPTDPDGRH